MRVFGVATLLMLAAAQPGPAWAQAQGVQLTVTSEDLGFNGYFRPGTWTPLRVTLVNTAAVPRQVVVEWEVRDVDSDPARWRRTVTLTPQLSTPVWLYAQPPFNAVNRFGGSSLRWRVRAYDADSGALLAQESLVVNTDRLRMPEVSFIGVTGRMVGGLEAFKDEYTQHQAIQYVPGLDPRRLPDRWYGLQGLSAVIWTTAGGAPDDAGVSQSAQRALREWLLRGGHLVVVLPPVGQRWIGSAMSELLPPVDLEAVRDRRPASLGRPPLGVIERVTPEMEYLALKPRPGADVAVLARDDAGRPIAVGHQVGLGCVTLIGVDLGEPRLLSLRLPSGDSGLWQSVFNWRSPGIDAAQVETMAANKGIAGIGPGERDRRWLARFVADLIAMRETAGPALLAAVLGFALYWLVAGPISHVILRARKLTQHSWLVFGSVVVVFTGLAWGGAWLIRPRKTRIQHFSVVRVDARDQHVHVHSQFSLFIARHGRADLALKPPASDAQADEFLSVLASPGDDPLGPQRRYAEEQTYTRDCTRPGEASVPMRATAKQFEADHLEHIPAGALSPSLFATKWIMPQGEVRIDPETLWFKDSQLIHGLPGAMRDLLFVYVTPGRRVLAWNHDKPWAPGEKLVLPTTTPRVSALELVRPRQEMRDNKLITRYDGVLPQLMGEAGGASDDDGNSGTKLKKITVSPLAVVRESQVLSFFGTLPPPDYQLVGFPGPRQYQRGLLRAIDLTPILHTPKLILLGHLEDSELPLPLTVDDRTPSSRGWTVVQWVLPLRTPAIAAPPAPAPQPPQVPVVPPKAP